MNHLYTAIKVRAGDWVAGKEPHNQPGVTMKFEESANVVVSTQMHEEGKLPLEPRIFAFFSVPESVLKNHTQVPSDNILGGTAYQGALPVTSIDQYQILLDRDALSEHPTIVQQNVAQDAKPDYTIANQYIMQRVHAFAVLEKVLANTEPELAAQVREALTSNEKLTHRPASEMTGMGAYTHALRNALGDPGLKAAQLYRAGNPAHFNNIMYTDSLGMDLMMRTIKQTMHNMVPQLDAKAVAELPHLYNALSKAFGGNQTPENVSAHVQAALRTFSGHLEPQSQDVVHNVSLSVPQIAQQAEKDMEHPAAQLLYQAVATAASSHATHGMFMSRFAGNPGNVQMYFRAALSNTDPTKTLDARLTEAAKQTLDAVQSQYRDNRSNLFNVPMHNNDAANVEQEELSEDEVGDGAI